MINKINHIFIDLFFVESLANYKKKMIFIFNNLKIL